jgi:hypothetical protein
MRRMIDYFSSTIKSEIVAKIDQVSNDINNIEKKLKDKGLTELQKFSIDPSNIKNKVLQDLCDKINAKITEGNFV